MIGALDFGTSNCSLGVLGDHGPELVPLTGDSPYLPSIMYAERREAAANVAGQSLEDALRSSKLLFGEDAITAHAAHPTEGFYFKSPKLFLASDLHERHLNTFRLIVTAMISEILEKTQARTGGRPSKLVIGNPVSYDLDAGRKKGSQAFALMEQAAREAGVTDIAFLPEPLAAALNYEMTVTADEVVLVVDVGGGTTDCAVVTVGPGRHRKLDRKKDLISCSGDWVGGVRMDFKFAWRQIMPLFGKDTLLDHQLPLPHENLINAISINDLQAQERFRRAGPAIRADLARADQPDKVRRLLALCQGGLQFKLMREVELAKIVLAGRDNTDLALDYVDTGLSVALSRRELLESIETELERIGTLALEAVKAASTSVDKIFITGGGSRSPGLTDSIRRALGRDIEVISGDDFGSVTLGLTRYARYCFA